MTHTDWNEPFTRFGRVLAEAEAAISKDPNAMQVATVDAHGFPSVRTVLLRGFDAAGFVFFTNYTSIKGRALLETRRAGLNFYWREIDQQVRIEGTVEQVSTDESDTYFAGRPRNSQLGAWASHQSQPLDPRKTLEDPRQSLTREYEGRPVPRPPHWGGFRVKPVRIEFWKADRYRLHEREEYVADGTRWKHQLLNP